MSNKKETPVSWLMEQFDLTSDASIIKNVIDKALQMESQKQQKYDEMLRMLEAIIIAKSLGVLDQADFTLIEKLIKEAKEL
jgi:hypothetical protein